MRKVILKMQISLDGVVSHENQWMSFSDDIILDAMNYYKTLDTLIFGSKTYPYMDDYWTKAEHSLKSSIESEFAKIINNFNKIVLSRSSLNLTWNNSQLINYSNNQSFINVINDLKKKSGKNISVESGIGMWHMFLENDLYDELLFYVHPTIVGDGVKLFNDEHFKVNLKLLNSKRIDKSVVILHYEKS